jgi:hypothetical protein
MSAALNLVVKRRQSIYGYTTSGDGRERSAEVRKGFYTT